MTNIKSPPPLPFKAPERMRIYPILTQAEAMNIIGTNCGRVHIAETHGSGRHTVILLPEAADQLRAMIAYGHRSPLNACEQLFNGYGHVFRKSLCEEGYLIIVKAFIEIKTTNRSAVHASAGFRTDGTANTGLDFLEYERAQLEKYEQTFNTDAFGAMIDPFLQDMPGSEYVLFGHTHPHPDHGAFFSPVDRERGRTRAAAGRPDVLFVADPVRREMKAAIGKDLEEAEVLVYDRGADQPAAEPAPAIEDLTRLASAILQQPGVGGKVRLFSRFGKKCVRIRMTLK